MRLLRPRGGEEGLGLSQVRRLAQRSGSAAKETKESINQSLAKVEACTSPVGTRERP